MPEPMDTIRRVNIDQPMTLDELHQARATLDRYLRRGKTDVQQARRRAGTRISELESAAPSLSPKDALDRARVFWNRLDGVADELTESELVKARTQLAPHAGDNPQIERTVRRIETRLNWIESRRPIANPVAGPKPGASAGSKIAAGVIAVALAVGAVSCIRSLGDGSGSGGGGGRNEGMAKVMCDHFIKDRLKAPSSADFSGIFSTTITGSGDDYTVVGTVDAENSFGAKLRSNYTCEVHDSGDDQWSLVSLTGID